MFTERFFKEQDPQDELQGLISELSALEVRQIVADDINSYDDIKFLELVADIMIRGRYKIKAVLIQTEEEIE